MDKGAWRTRLRARRGALTEEERDEAQSRMVDHFTALPAAERTGRVLVYVAVDPEARTRRLIERLWADGATVCLPRLDRSRPGWMDVVPVSGWDELVAGPYFDIPQPSFDVPALDAHTLDVIVLPGVGFDRKGRRIGQAGGYYDRLLAKIGRNAVRIGWAFSAQYVERLPEEAHDERVDMLITEDGVQRFHDAGSPSER